MKALLTALFARIKTVTAIKWIDEDFGQIDNYQGDRPPVSFPCALVAIDQQGDDLGSDAYDITSNIVIRIAHDRLGDRSGMGDSAAIALSLAKLDDVESVRAALDGYEVPGNVSGRFYLKFIVTERRTDGIAVKVLTFTETH